MPGSLVRVGALLVCMVLQACSAGDDIASISYTVERDRFISRIPARGELEAKESTPISLSTNVYQIQTISWLAEENTYVKQGELVAQIDTRYFANSLEQEGLKIAQEDIKYQSKQKTLLTEQDDIVVEAGLLKKEHVLASRFSLRDLTFVSRKEIIDKIRDKEFVEARQYHNSWRGGVHQEKTASELGLLQLQREQLTNAQSYLLLIVQNAEVRAPHDGYLVLEMNHMGEKYRPGDVLFPGSTFASIPDLSELQARVFVLEAESSGLKPDLRAELRLRAFPNEKIEGTVIKVGAIAKRRNQENPLKYFDCVVRINTPMDARWRPGLQLDASIFALELESALTVPSQAIFRDGGENYVLLRTDGVWMRRVIEIGARNLARSEVVTGLDAGDVIALYRLDNLDG